VRSTWISPNMIANVREIVRNRVFIAFLYDAIILFCFSSLALTDDEITVVGSFTVEVVVETIVVLGFSRNEDFRWSMNSNFGDLIFNKDYLT